MSTTGVQLVQGRVDVGQPYLGLYRELDLLGNYVHSFEWDEPDDALSMPGPESLLAVCNEAGRKPRLALFGFFDVGKSTLVNTLLGTSAIHVAYQPATRVLTFLRHTSDRPEWFSDAVLVLGNGFDPEAWGDEEACRAHEVASGGLDVLRDHGTHHFDEDEASSAAIALVYLDCPVLHSCTIIDTPGFDSTNETDTQLALDPRVAFDVAIWADNVQGFLGKASLVIFASILRRLPYIRGLNSPLANLFIVGTHAHSYITDDQLENEIFSNARMRMWRHLGETALVERSESDDAKIVRKDLDERFFPFSRENPTRSGDLFRAMEDLLGSELPEAWIERVRTKIDLIRDSGSAVLDGTVNTYQQMFDERHVAELKLATIDANELTRRARVRQSLDQISEVISAELGASVQAMQAEVVLQTSGESIKKTLLSKFPELEDAKDNVADLILEELQHAIGQDLRPRAARITEMVTEVLNHIEEVSLGGKSRTGTDFVFNAKAVFLIRLSKFDDLGALEQWVEAMANFDDDVTATAAGSGGVAVALVAAGVFAFGAAATIGVILAPITVILAIGNIKVVGFKRVAKDVWRWALAKGVAIAFTQADVGTQFQAGLVEFWSDTRSALLIGMDSVEAEYQAHREQTRLIVKANDVHRIQELRDLSKKRWSWFSGLRFGDS